MVLLREELVKIDASNAALAPLERYGNVDSSPVAMLLDGFLERVF
jgi:hypothetical protein